MKILPLTLLSTAMVFNPFIVSIASADSGSVASLRGEILLAAEARGELWYVKPDTLRRDYFATPYHVFLMMKDGVGMRSADLQKIPVGILVEQSMDTDQDGLSNSLEYGMNLSESSEDTDKDGVTDGVEVVNHTNPKGAGSLPLDKKLATRFAGYIVLDVQNRGQAWYIHPDTQQRFYLGKPSEAYLVFVKLAKGISNQHLAQIPIQ